MKKIQTSVDGETWFDLPPSEDFNLSAEDEEADRVFGGEPCLSVTWRIPLSGVDDWIEEFVAFRDKHAGVKEEICNDPAGL